MEVVRMLRGQASKTDVFKVYGVHLRNPPPGTMRIDEYGKFRVMNEQLDAFAHDYLPQPLQGITRQESVFAYPLTRAEVADYFAAECFSTGRFVSLDVDPTKVIVADLDLIEQLYSQQSGWEQGVERVAAQYWGSAMSLAAYMDSHIKMKNHGSLEWRTFDGNSRNPEVLIPKREISYARVLQ